MPKYYLKESHPAKEFSDAHFLGNGRLGASVYGNVGVEKVIINEDSLWSGYEEVIRREDYYDHLEVAKKLTLEGKYLEANNYMDEHLTGSWSQSYIPLGTLNVTYGLGSNLRTSVTMESYRDAHGPITDYENYSRMLDIDDAVSTVQYTHNGIEYEREMFVSFDYQVMAMKISAKNHELKCAVSLKSELKHSLSTEGGFVCMKGCAPDNVEPQYSAVEPGVVYFEEGENDTLRFASCAMIAETDGDITTDRLRTYINNATYAVVLIAAGTNHAGYDVKRTKTAKDVLKDQQGLLTKASALSYEELKAIHIKDYKSLYERVTLDLGESITDSLDTSKRFELYKNTIQDPTITALQMQYARYLMISGSRAGTIPLNLQGIWNELMRPAWSSNYTVNINTQMNYWLAESLNLSECHGALTDFIYYLAKEGEETAKHFFRAPGWVANHNMDIWGHSVQTCETAYFSYWIFGGVWLCQHIWTHYEYTRDTEFLKKFYPVLRGAAEFILSQLVEDESGVLVTAPSTSPENRFLAPEKASYKDLVENISAGNRTASRPDAVCAICKGSTSDMTMTRELFRNLKNAAKILGIEDELLVKTEEAVKKLRPYEIGRFGQLMEWDKDFEEPSPGFGHMSQLYGIYPSEIINQYDTPELFDGAKISFLRKRNHHSLSSGWPGAWGICLGARLGFAESCLEICSSIGGKFGAGMLTKGFASQIDAIFGLGAGISEMLLQSHCDRVILLPAIPTLWLDGEYSGFKARGGFAVSVKWKDGKITEASIKSELGNELKVKAKGLLGVEDSQGNITKIDGDYVTMSTVTNGFYKLVF